MLEAEKHLGIKQHYYIDSNGNFNKNILISDEDPRKIVRFDIDNSRSHVILIGQHLNLETYLLPFGTPGQSPIVNKHIFWRK